MGRGLVGSPGTPVPRSHPLGANLSRFLLLCPRFFPLKISAPSHLVPQLSFFLLHFRSIQFFHFLSFASPAYSLSVLYS